MEIQQTEGYREGFWDAQDGEPLFLDSTPEYRTGWLAFHSCKAILAGTDPDAPAREFQAWLAR